MEAVEWENKEKPSPKRVCRDSTDTNARGLYPVTAMEGKAFCEGYDETFRCLLQNAEMQPFIIIGASSNPAIAGNEDVMQDVLHLHGFA